MTSTSKKPRPVLVKEHPANDVAELTTRERRAQLAHSLIVDVFAKRIRDALAYGFEAFTGTIFVAAAKEADPFDPRTAPGVVDAMAERLASHLEASMVAYNVPAKIRHGVCLRLAQHWRLDAIPERTDSRGIAVPAHVDVPFTVVGVDGYASRREYFAAVWELKGHNDVAVMEYQAEAAGRVAPRMVWPSNVSLDDARAVLERSREPDAIAMAETFRAGRWYVVPPSARVLRPGTFEPRPENYTPDPDRPGWSRIADPAFSRGLRSIFHPQIAACVSWAEKTQAEKHAGSFAVPSSKVARAMLANASTGPKASAWESFTLRGRRAMLRVKWEGRLKPGQYSLSFARTATELMVSEVLEELSEDGLRDIFALLAMAEEQGRTGEKIKWTWERHRVLAGYDVRVRNGWSRHENGIAVHVTDEQLRRACIRRLWQFTRAEFFAELDGVLSEKPVGNAPFVVIHFAGTGDPKGLKQDGLFTAAIISLNPMMYEGAHRDSKAQHHTGFHQSMFSLRGPAFRLAVFLFLAERYARDKGMRVSLSESTLVRYAGVRVDGKPSRRDITHARAELQGYLDAVNAVTGDGACGTWREGASGERMYDKEPSLWRVERDLLGAAPNRPQPRLDVPRTGAELVRWRERRKLSQREAAEVLGVSKRTITSAEVNASKGLPRSFRSVDWNARRALEAPALPMLEARNPPVEGEDAKGPSGLD